MEPLIGESSDAAWTEFSWLCFIGMGSKLTVMRLFFRLVLPLLRVSGKDKTMKTPIEFDYDLWTTEEGKCMVRVKLTGEVCEVSRETMRVLRNEEKKLRRSKTGVPIAGCDDEDETETVTTTPLTADNYFEYIYSEAIDKATAEADGCSFLVSNPNIQ